MAKVFNPLHEMSEFSHFVGFVGSAAVVRGILSLAQTTNIADSFAAAKSVVAKSLEVAATQVDNSVSASLANIATTGITSRDGSSIG